MEYDTYICEHTDEARAFTTTTTTLELGEALEKGYKVTDFYRAWHWNDWSEEIFRGYMQKFLKVFIPIVCPSS